MIRAIRCWLICLFSFCGIALAHAKVEIIFVGNEIKTECRLPFDLHRPIGNAALDIESMCVAEHSSIYKDGISYISSVGLPHKSMVFFHVIFDILRGRELYITISRWLDLIAYVVLRDDDISSVIHNWSVKISSDQFPCEPHGRGSSRILIRNLNVDWTSFGQWKPNICPEGINPRPISVDGSLIGVFNAFVDEAQAYQSDSSGSGSNPIKPTRQTKLPFPEALLGGLVIAFLGARINALGIERGPFIALIGGWCMMVVGGFIMLAWAFGF